MSNGCASPAPLAATVRILFLSTNSSRLPSGEKLGESPAPTLCGTPPAVTTTHTSLGIGAFGGVINVGRSFVVKTLTPCEGDRLRIRRPGEFADIETVVPCVRCDLARFRATGGVSNPDITVALRVEYPRHGCARGRGHHVVREWRPHHIVGCKGRWMGSPSLRHE